MILITGGEGFVGSHLVEKLSDAQPLDDRSFNKYTFKNTIVMDICSPDIFEIVKQSDYVIHCACRDIRNSITKPLEDAEVNILGTLNLLQACRKYNKMFVYISSVSVHQEASHYAISKRTAERYALFYRQWIPTIIIRLSNVFGSRDTESVIAKWLKNDVITLIKDGTQTRDFTYIEDAINGIIKSIEKKPEEIIDIGTGSQTKLVDLANWLSHNTNKKVIFHPKREIDNVLKRVVDIEKMKTYLDFKPKWNLYDALKYMLNKI